MPREFSCRKSNKKAMPRPLQLPELQTRNFFLIFKAPEAPLEAGGFFAKWFLVWLFLVKRTQFLWGANLKIFKNVHCDRVKHQRMVAYGSLGSRVYSHDSSHISFNAMIAFETPRWAIKNGHNGHTLLAAARPTPGAAGQHEVLHRQ